MIQYESSFHHSDMISYDSELMHHGVKGMKWGERRYQNPDGSLTEEGKRASKRTLYRAFQGQRRSMNDRYTAGANRMHAQAIRAQASKYRFNKKRRARVAGFKAYNREQVAKTYDKLSKDNSVGSNRKETKAIHKARMQALKNTKIKTMRGKDTTVGRERTKRIILSTLAGTAAVAANYAPEIKKMIKRKRR